MSGRKPVGVRCEPLEKRVLLNGVNEHIGELDGRAYRQGSVSGLQGTDQYHFHLAQPGTIDIQVSRPIGTGRVVLEQGTDLAQPTNFIGSTAFSDKDKQLHETNMPAGDYIAVMQPDTNQLFPAFFYTLEIVTDFAGGARVTWCGWKSRPIFRRSCWRSSANGWTSAPRTSTKSTDRWIFEC